MRRIELDYDIMLQNSIMDACKRHMDEIDQTWSRGDPSYRRWTCCMYNPESRFPFNQAQVAPWCDSKIVDMARRSVGMRRVMDAEARIDELEEALARHIRDRVADRAGNPRHQSSSPQRRNHGHGTRDESPSPERQTSQTGHNGGRARPQSPSPRRRSDRRDTRQDSPSRSPSPRRRRHYEDEARSRDNSASSSPRRRRHYDDEARSRDNSASPAFDRHHRRVPSNVSDTPRPSPGVGSRYGY